MDGPAQGSLFELVGFTDVERHGAGLLQHFGGLARQHLGDAGAGVVQEFTWSGHTK